MLRRIVNSERVTSISISVNPLLSFILELSREISRQIYFSWKLVMVENLLTERRIAGVVLMELC
ncbi:hypothetical protein A9R10_21705 [Aeromonas piscicola]|nr:hypothetical protein A9R10_21705 [Aeromonas piscicola]